MCFVDYDEFINKMKVDSISGYYPDEMDIIKAKNVMNINDVSFSVGNHIVINDITYLIVAFAGRDNDYLGAIVKRIKIVDEKVCKGKKCFYVRLDSAINLTYKNSLNGTPQGILYNKGYKFNIDKDMEKGNITISIEDDLCEIWVDGKDNMVYSVLSDICIGKLECVLEVLETTGIINKFYKNITKQDIKKLKMACL